jgi:cytochrome c oxidase subunit 2
LDAPEPNATRRRLVAKYSIVYLIVAVFGLALFVIGPWYGWSLPANFSVVGRDIDHLYYFILILIGIVFVGTQACLVYVLYRFGRGDDRRKALYIHGSRKLEIIWTVIPAGVLLFLELYQIPTWLKLRFQKPDIEPIARVIARQFEWRIVYPGPDNRFDTVDDIHVVNELHIPMNRRILIDLRAMDVIHSFFLPHFRIKQDAIPGTNIPVWFEPDIDRKWFEPSTYQNPEEHKQSPLLIVDEKTGRRELRFPLVCAELCGWGHYKMKGRLVVHETEDELRAWLQERYADQEATR